MSEVYSTQFALQQYTTPGDHTAYTCPAAKVAILRDVIIRYVGPTSGKIEAYVNGIGGGVGLLMVKAGAVTTEALEWQGRQVMNAGDQLIVQNSVDEVQIYASGYLLDSP